jgi:hypothetical protein
MKYAFAMDSGAMIYIPGFIKIGGGCTKRHRKHDYLISLLLFFSK